MPLSPQPACCSLTLSLLSLLIEEEFMENMIPSSRAAAAAVSTSNVLEGANILYGMNGLLACFSIRKLTGAKHACLPSFYGLTL